MTLNTRVTDDHLGRFYRKTAAIADRLDKSLEFNAVMNALQRIHDGQFELDEKSTDFFITVDYNLSLKEMIAAGRYDWTNSDITEKRFPVNGEGKVKRKAEIVHFNYEASSEQVVKGLDKKGLRPATIEDLLAFGAKYPDEQRKYPIVALASPSLVDGYRGVAYLGGDGSKRGLSLRGWGGDWLGLYRFLAFAKEFSGP